MDNVTTLYPKPEKRVNELSKGEAEALKAMQKIVADAILEMVEDYYDDEDIGVSEIRGYAEQIRRGD